MRISSLARSKHHFPWGIAADARLFSGRGKYYTIKDYLPRRKKNLNWVQSDENDEINLVPRQQPPKPSTRVVTLTDFVTRQPTEQVVTVKASMPEHVQKSMRALRPYWRIVHLGHSATTKLYRINRTGPKIVLSFHCQDAVVNPMPYPKQITPRAANQSRTEVLDQRDQMLCRDHDDALVVPPPVAFTLTITNPHKQSLVIIGIADDDAMTLTSLPAVRIHHVSVTPTHVDIVHATGAVNPTAYGGRAFATMTPRRQEAWNRYLEDEIRVDRDMVKFITTYFVYREEQHYEQFLLRFHDLVQ